VVVSGTKNFEISRDHGRIECDIQIELPIEAFHNDNGAAGRRDRDYLMSLPRGSRVEGGGLDTRASRGLKSLGSRCERARPAADRSPGFRYTIRDGVMS